MIKFLQKYLGNLIVPILWTLILTFLLCIPGQMLPSEAHFSIPQFDKIVHISLFGGFVFLWDLYLSKRALTPQMLLRWFFLLFVLGCGLGISMEFIQKCCIPFRDFDTEDIIADMIGAGLGYGFSNIWLVSFK